DAAPQGADLHRRGTGGVPPRRTLRSRQRRDRRLSGARGGLRTEVGGEGDRQGPARDLGLRVGVPDEPAQSDARARGRNGLRHGEPSGELRLVERREGDRGLRRRRLGARAAAGGSAARGDLPQRASRDAGKAGRMSELDVTLRDGRTLHVYDSGDPDGRVVVEHHGTPGSGLVYPPDLALGRARALRIGSYDRAGYGGSTPNPGRSVVDVVPDIDDVVEALEVERYVTLGGSGGCPHSFACGARSERCIAAAAIASPTPYEAEGLDWL